MTSGTPPDSSDRIDETTHRWLCDFLSRFELSLLDSCQGFATTPSRTDLHTAVLRAAKESLLRSGVDERELSGLLFRAVFEADPPATDQQWTADLNARRFELIDLEIQQSITDHERVELAELTSLMRLATETEENLPFTGARKLHSYLLEMKEKNSEN